MLNHVERDCELGLELESLRVVECPYNGHLRAAPKRAQHDTVLNMGRWLCDAFDNPMEGTTWWRWFGQNMEGTLNLESKKSHDESNP